MFETLKLIAVGASALYALYWFRHNECSRALIFIFVLIYFRFVLASYHETTFPKVVGPFSINALYSIMMIGLALFFINLKIFSYRSFTVFKVLIFLMLISAVINHTLGQSIPSIIKWLLALEVMTLFLYAFIQDGPEKTTKATVIAFIYPVAMQLISILTGTVKANESDGSASYIGGFFHEAVFSVILFTGMVVGIMWLRHLKINFKQVAIFYMIFFLFLLVMVNYRTTLISSLPILAFFAYEHYWKGNIAKKVLFMVLALIAFSGLMLVNTDKMVERFSDIPTALEKSSELMVAPQYYTREQRRLFSGRIYLWNRYITRTNQGTAVQTIIGHGMDSWREHFLLYAHNTFVSFYYELGYLGLVILIYIFALMFRMIFSIREKKVRTLLMGMTFSFMVLNLGTMPLWQIEGIFLFSFIFSIVYYYSIKHKLKPLYKR